MVRISPASLSAIAGIGMITLAGAMTVPQMASAQAARQPGCQAILLDRTHLLRLVTNVGVTTTLGPYAGGFAQNDQISLRNSVGANLANFPVNVTFVQGATRQTFANVQGQQNVHINMGVGGFNLVDPLSIEVTPFVSVDHSVEIECNTGIAAIPAVGGGTTPSTTATQQAGAADIANATIASTGFGTAASDFPTLLVTPTPSGPPSTPFTDAARSALEASRAGVNRDVREIGDTIADRAIDGLSSPGDAPIPLSNADRAALDRAVSDYVDAMFEAQLTSMGILNVSSTQAEQALATLTRVADAILGENSDGYKTSVFTDVLGLANGGNEDFTPNGQPSLAERVRANGDVSQALDAADSGRIDDADLGDRVQGVENFNVENTETVTETVEPVQQSASFEQGVPELLVTPASSAEEERRREALLTPLFPETAQTTQPRENPVFPGSIAAQQERIAELEAFREADAESLREGIREAEQNYINDYILRNPDASERRVEDQQTFIRWSLERLVSGLFGQPSGLDIESVTTADLHVALGIDFFGAAVRGTEIEREIDGFWDDLITSTPSTGSGDPLQGVDQDVIDRVREREVINAVLEGDITVEEARTMPPFGGEVDFGSEGDSDFDDGGDILGGPGEGETILFRPYGENGFDLSFDTDMLRNWRDGAQRMAFAGERPTIGGMPYNVWTKARYVSLNGDASNPEGHVLSFQAGTILKLSDTREVGLFLLGNSGEFKTASTGVNINQSSTGIGAHGSVMMERGGRLTASLTTEQGNADITQGTTTGSYDYAQTSLSFGWGTQYELAGMTFAPGVSLSVNHYTRDAYTDSAATAVTGKSETNSALSVSSRASRQYEMSPDSGMVGYVPFVSANVNYTNYENGTITVSTTEVIDREALSASLSFGVDGSWQNGLQAGATIGINGLQKGRAPNPSLALRGSWPF